MPKFIYRFSLGDSNEGQVGFCFDLVLEQEKKDEDEAAVKCREALSEYGAEDSMTGLSILPEPFSGICVYVNPTKITADDIVMSDEVK